MTTEKLKIEKGISEIAGVFTDPIIVYPGGWGDTIPQWLKEAITLERLTMEMRALHGEERTATEAEACAYLMTASLTQPMDSDWTQIYLYIASQVIRRHRQTEIPKDILVKELDDYRLHKLHQLRDWIYQRRTRIRLEQDRADRQERKEALKEKHTLEQTALFEF